MAVAMKQFSHRLLSPSSLHRRELITMNEAEKQAISTATTSPILQKISTVHTLPCSTLPYLISLLQKCESNAAEKACAQKGEMFSKILLDPRHSRNGWPLTEQFPRCQLKGN